MVTSVVPMDYKGNKKGCEKTKRREVEKRRSQWSLTQLIPPSLVDVRWHCEFKTHSMHANRERGDKSRPKLMCVPNFERREVMDKAIFLYSSVFKKHKVKQVQQLARLRPNLKNLHKK